MATAAKATNESIHLRLDASSKRKLERATAYEEPSVSRFVLQNALAAAERVIEVHERIVTPAIDARPSRTERCAEANHVPLPQAHRWMKRHYAYRSSSP